MDDNADVLATADDIREAARVMIRLDEGMQIKEIVVKEDHYLITVARPGKHDWYEWIYEYEIENHKVYREAD
jgi:hypothetical protein